jgi:polar amino acid transport system substrate-binding protein
VRSVLWARPKTNLTGQAGWRRSAWLGVVLCLIAALPAPGADQRQTGLSASPSDDTLGAIRRRGVLRWGADAEGGAPYVFPDASHPEKYTGFEKELAEALAAKLGVRAEMTQNSWEQMVPALLRGNFDVILNGLELTADNQREIAMSRPYFAYAQQIVTRKDSTGLTRLEDLKGRNVGILAATAAQKLVENLGGVNAKVYPGNVETLRDLKAGRIDAVVLDLPIALYYAKPDHDLKFSGRPFAPGYYGLGVRKEDKALLAALNQAIGELAEDRTLERIYSRYGLWDSGQEHVKDYQPEIVASGGHVSTLREWPKYLPLLLKGAVVTIELSVIAMALAASLGLLLALARLYGPAPVRWMAAAYIELVRGTPLLIQLYLIYYGLPNLGIRFSAFVAAILGLGCNYAANEAENYRAGIQGVPSGQMEAALALGMTRGQALRRIILPQAFRLVIPPVTNDFIAMFKDSSIVSVITMVELTKVYGMLAMSTYDYIGLGVMTAGLYFVLSYPASLFAARLEKRLRHDPR